MFSASSIIAATRIASWYVIRIHFCSYPLCQLSRFCGRTRFEPIKTHHLSTVRNLNVKLHENFVNFLDQLCLLQISMINECKYEGGYLMNIFFRILYSSVNIDRYAVSSGIKYSYSTPASLCTTLFWNGFPLVSHCSQLTNLWTSTESGFEGKFIDDKSQSILNGLQIYRQDVNLARRILFIGVYFLLPIYFIFRFQKIQSQISLR